MTATVTITETITETITATAYSTSTVTVTGVTNPLYAKLTSKIGGIASWGLYTVERTGTVTVSFYLSARNLAYLQWVSITSITGTGIGGNVVTISLAYGQTTVWYKPDSLTAGYWLTAYYKAPVSVSPSSTSCYVGYYNAYITEYVHIDTWYNEVTIFLTTGAVYASPEQIYVLLQCVFAGVLKCEDYTFVKTLPATITLTYSYTTTHTLIIYYPDGSEYRTTWYD